MNRFFSFMGCWNGRKTVPFSTLPLIMSIISPGRCAVVMTHLHPVYNGKKALSINIYAYMLLLHTESLCINIYEYVLLLHSES